MLLKFLVYAVAIWFFFRIIRRLAVVWLGIKHVQSGGNRPSGTRPSAGSRRIDDVEEADYTEIDDNR